MVISRSIHLAAEGVVVVVWPCLQHAEVPRPGIEPSPQQWQHRILNLLGHQGTPLGMVLSIVHLLHENFRKKCAASLEWVKYQNCDSEKSPGMTRQRQLQCRERERPTTAILKIPSNFQNHFLLLLKNQKSEQGWSWGSMTLLKYVPYE